ncbi:MAG: hypothetical protein ONB48_12445 [candidate division KSB1 bacterium]|nr:hypothetical protein [candidate division KSB1 bacterium]MDZ7275096.1 hypothetical protein [candidate division KSB1 bacterium]MDZ7286456.1 hypothetical protein [candidate division KSB1 bacterium]MDZ7299380.1 hypothetical protein [candidate division KSB1 bacterium]MDZ7306291.1 hypothetical protein [candidate division KSB1 bacterium]
MSNALHKITALLRKPFQPWLRLLAGNRRAQIIFLLFLLPLPLALFVLAVALPVRQLAFEAPPAKSAGEDSTSHQHLKEPEDEAEKQALAERRMALAIEEAFWQVRYQMSKSDSIGLVVNLSDSLVILEVKGVPLRQCRIIRYDRSDALDHLAAKGRLRQWLASPFILQRELATLPKAPIRIIEAPKDTIEAEQRKTEIPIEDRDVHFTWEFDRNLTVVVEQEQTPSWEGRLQKLWYETKRTWNTTAATIDSLTRRRLPEHRFWIALELNRDDAKAIYRALPKHASLALHL